MIKPLMAKMESDVDQKSASHTGRYNAALLFPLILIAGLNILDSLFTMMILDNKGREVNPIVLSVIELYGDGFWIWKFGIVSTGIIICCLFSRFKLAKSVILSTSSFYLIVVMYQMILLQ